MIMEIDRAGPGAGTPDFLRTWRQDYDYLVVVGSPGSDSPGEGLTPVARGARFVIHRISRGR
jgi:hypothetical protein